MKDVNNVNVRSVAQSIGITVEEKKSDEPVTFNEWVHVQLFSNGKKLVSAGGTFFGSLPNNPRIVRVVQPSLVEIPVTGTLLLLNNTDKPGIVGQLEHVAGQAQRWRSSTGMSLRRDMVGGLALTGVEAWTAPPPQALLNELQKDTDISNVKVGTVINLFFEPN